MDYFYLDSSREIGITISMHNNNNNLLLTSINILFIFDAYVTQGKIWADAQTAIVKLLFMSLFLILGNCCQQ